MNTRFELHKADPAYREHREHLKQSDDYKVIETELQWILQASSRIHPHLQGMDPSIFVTVAISNLPDPVPYEKIIVDVKDKPEIKKHMEDATKLLNYALCTFPDYDKKDLDELFAKTRRMQPDGFPFSIKIVDDKAYEEVLLPGYDGPVYWNTHTREHIIDWEKIGIAEHRGNVFETPLKPIKMKDAGQEPLTVKTLCEAIAKLDYWPGDHRFLERVVVELREIDGVEAITIIFSCGS